MGKEAAIVPMEGVVQCPDPVLILVCPPCCYLAHNPVLPCLSHAQDCLHLSPNHLSLILPLLPLQGRIISSHKSTIVASIESKMKSSQLIRQLIFTCIRVRETRKTWLGSGALFLPGLLKSGACLGRTPKHRGPSAGRHVTGAMASIS